MGTDPPPPPRTRQGRATTRKEGGPAEPTLRTPHARSWRVWWPLGVNDRPVVDAVPDGAVRDAELAHRVSSGAAARSDPPAYRESYIESPPPGRLEIVRRCASRFLSKASSATQHGQVPVVATVRTCPGRGIPGFLCVLVRRSRVKSELAVAARGRPCRLREVPPEFGENPPRQELWDATDVAQVEGRSRFATRLVRGEARSPQFCPIAACSCNHIRETFLHLLKPHPESTVHSVPSSARSPADVVLRAGDLLIGAMLPRSAILTVPPLRIAE